MPILSCLYVSGNVDGKLGVQSQLQAEVTTLKEKCEARAKEALKAKDQRDAANKEIGILKASDTAKHRDHESITLRAKSLEVIVLNHQYPMRLHLYLFDYSRIVSKDCSWK